MKKLQKTPPVFKGEVTAFLALIFLLMLSVVGALLESASIQVTKSRRRADTALALESTFAEYHTELLENYHIFARLISDEEEVNSRLAYYGASVMEHSVSQMELLTDYQGGEYYRQAVEYMKHWLGVDELFPDEKYQFDTDSTLEDAEQENADYLEQMLQDGEEELPSENNPIESVEKLKNSPLLSIIAEEPQELSNRSINTADLPSKRNLREGNMEHQAEAGIADKWLFVQYLTEHFTDATDEDAADEDVAHEEAVDEGPTKDGHALVYELEYLLEGKQSDQKNLEAVCETILMIRMVDNFLYLQTDSAKTAEAELLAAAICNVLTVTGISVVVKQAILFAWAYGESIVDMRALLKGKKAALVKTSETWQLQLSNLAKLGTSEEVADEKDVSGGFSYEDYLKGLLLIEEKEDLCMRSLDLIESNLQIQTDRCMTKAVIKSEAVLWRGIEDTFTTAYGYQ